jgi:hypothetical protein
MFSSHDLLLAAAKTPELRFRKRAYVGLLALLLIVFGVFAITNTPSRRNGSEDFLFQRNLLFFHKGGDETQASPTMMPTMMPTKMPTEIPTMMPTEIPTMMPTKMPTEMPNTAMPTKMPTEMPNTAMPTKPQCDKPDCQEECGISNKCETRGCLTECDKKSCESIAACGCIPLFEVNCN